MNALTEREAAVLRGIVAGKMYKQIAAEHGRAMGTIKVQVRQLLQKTGTRTRTELAVLAVREGLV